MSDETQPFQSSRVSEREGEGGREREPERGRFVVEVVNMFSCLLCPSVSLKRFLSLPSATVQCIVFLSVCYLLCLQSSADTGARIEPTGKYVERSNPRPPPSPPPLGVCASSWPLLYISCVLVALYSLVNFLDPCDLYTFTQSKPSLQFTLAFPPFPPPDTPTYPTLPYVHPPHPLRWKSRRCAT